MSFNIDARTVLVDALKLNSENFELSNLIFKNTRVLRAVYELNALKSEMLEFAKDPEVGLNMLGPPPPLPKLDGMDEDTAERAKVEYAELLRMYEQQKESLSMNVPHSDFMMIENYLDKYRKTLAATPAVKGNRFYAFTKNVEQEQGGFLSFLKQNNAQQ